MATAIKLKVQGMDCAACVSKIETAVGRLDGVSNVRVGLQSETLSAELADPTKVDAIRKTVKSLGYEITDTTAKSSKPAAAKPAHDHSSHAGHDHSDLRA